MFMHSAHSLFWFLFILLKKCSMFHCYQLVGKSQLSYLYVQIFDSLFLYNLNQYDLTSVSDISTLDLSEDSDLSEVHQHIFQILLHTFLIIHPKLLLHFPSGFAYLTSFYRSTTLDEPVLYLVQRRQIISWKCTEISLYCSRI